MNPARMAGCLLLLPVGYHYINQPLGFSNAGSIACGLFSLCLISVYRGYHPDLRNWIGWSTIAVGCLLLASRSGIDLLLALSLIMITVGFWLAELSFGGLGSQGGDGGFGGDLGGCDGGGGDGGGD